LNQVSQVVSQVSQPTAAIYSGTIDHRRYVEADHAFSYGIYMLWLSVADVDRPGVVWPLISRKPFALLSVLASDYMASRPEQTLMQRLAAEVKARTGIDWKGDAYMLAHGRHLGFVMNPLALYYLYGESGQLQFIVGEITNTPWGERHCYVMDTRGHDLVRPGKFEFKKSFHVSPFLPMDMDYTWMMSAPSDRLTVGIWNRHGARLDFEAHLKLRRKPLTKREVVKNLIIMPIMTFKVLYGIYWNAAVLFLAKRVTFYDHPKLNQKGESYDNNSAPS
jgi:DUF1365 family protein